MDQARASIWAYRAPTVILAVKRRLAATQGSHDRRGEIVLSVGASRIAARYEKKGRSLLNHDAAGVRASPDFGAFLDLESKAEQVGYLLTKPWSLVLPAAPLGESLSLGTVASIVHHTPTISSARPSFRSASLSASRSRSPHKLPRSCTHPVTGALTALRRRRFEEHQRDPVARTAAFSGRTGRDCS